MQSSGLHFRKMTLAIEQKTDCMYEGGGEVAPPEAEGLLGGWAVP